MELASIEKVYHGNLGDDEHLIRPFGAPSPQGEGLAQKGFPLGGKLSPQVTDEGKLATTFREEPLFRFITERLTIKSQVGRQEKEKFFMYRRRP